MKTSRVTEGDAGMWKSETRGPEHPRKTLNSEDSEADNRFWIFNNDYDNDKVHFNHRYFVHSLIILVGKNFDLTLNGVRCGFRELLLTSVAHSSLPFRLE